jgi:hypothetical protein
MRTNRSPQERLDLPMGLAKTVVTIANRSC